MGLKILIKASIVLLIAVVLIPFSVNAQEEDLADDSREPAAAKAARATDAQAASRARYRLYPGGQDEQEIVVQPALPQAQRYLDPSQAPQPRAASTEE